jgi:hypothetical protein
MAYLRALAAQTGTTFTPPHTRRQASCEIDRVRRLRDVRGAHIELPADDDDKQFYATALQAHEVSGFGSSARWRVDTPAGRRAPRQHQVGALTELARYEVAGGERVLYGQRIDGCVKVTDRPANGAGRSYVVDRELERDGYGALKALVSDYLEQAKELDAIPMASSSLASQL